MEIVNWIMKALKLEININLHMLKVALNVAHDSYNVKKMLVILFCN